MAEFKLTSFYFETDRTLLALPILEPKKRSKYLNGVNLPEEIDRAKSESAFRAVRNIAAIDFGTTACSLAYSLQDTDQIRFVKLDNEDTRVPTAILVDENGEVICFGKQARKRYASLPMEKKKQCFYFHQFKMSLQHDKSVGWNHVVKALNGKEFFLVEVIAMILKFVKNRLLNVEVAKNPTGLLEASDFDWVITVPAIWKARGKQMMREAAYKAGIASEDSEISKLTLVEKSGEHFTSISPRVDERLATPEALSLALEPEAAALCCLDHAKSEKVKCANTKCYMVLDIGGGTVDISAHKVLDSGAVEVILPPTGNSFGGTRINDQFKIFLGELVGDPDFHRYLFTGNPVITSKNSADLDVIVNQRFEDQKKFFGDEGPCDKEALIELPYSFMTTYEHSLKEGIATLGDKHVNISGSELLISYHKMEEFFHEPMQHIICCVSESLDKVAGMVDTVFCVGGFGGCKYVYNKIESQIKQSQHHRCEVFRPADHTMAVVTGAVIFRKNPEIVKSRVADASYGSDCCRAFDNMLHDRAYRFYDDDRDEYCDNLFAPFVLKDDIVRADKVLTSKYFPLKHNQRGMTFEIYTTKKTNMKYVKTHDNKKLPGITKIGLLNVNMPDATGDKRREVKLTFDFSHTEIQIEAYDVTSGEKAHTTVDFLTDLDL